MNMKTKNPILKTMKASLMNLPTPASISYLWNWGSLLGTAMLIQLMTGIFLASHYTSDTSTAFKSVIEITRNVNYGYQLRFMHMNTASFFFVCMFIHMGRSIYISSYKNNLTWLSGVVIALVLMGTAFLGYVLPWGQMSFWGATVITNLLSAIPWVGSKIVEWLWGGFSIGQATLNRFFTLHFLMPFMLIMIIVFHLTFLHQNGSNKPVGAKQDLDKISFHPYFSVKDAPTFLALIMAALMVSYATPFVMGDPENFNLANPLNTPIHIQPEWYFLFAYAILRSIPNKLGGVVALMMSIVSMSLLALFKSKITTKKWTPTKKTTMWLFFSTFLLLTWIGAMPVEKPFESAGSVFSFVYFSMITSLCF